MRPVAPSVQLRSEAETLVSCDWCEGHGMVSIERRAEWLATYAELSRACDVIPERRQHG